MKIMIEFLQLLKIWHKHRRLLYVTLVSFVFIMFILQPTPVWSSPSPRYSVTIHAIRVADDKGTNPTNISPSEIQSWVDRANQIFAPAGIQLVLEPVSGSFLWSSSINSVTNDTSSRGFKDATQVAKQYPDKIVVFFRNVKGNGFSGGSYNFVGMPRFSDSWIWPGVQGDTSQTQNIGQLAHDIGHYLGLRHTFPGDRDPREDMIGKILLPICFFLCFGAAFTTPSPNIVNWDGERSELFEKCDRIKVVNQHFHQIWRTKKMKMTPKTLLDFENAILDLFERSFLYSCYVAMSSASMQLRCAAMSSKYLLSM